VTDVNNLLLSLYQHEVELCCLYQEGVEHIKTPKVRDALQNFLSKHSRHVATLSQLFSWPERPIARFKEGKSYLHSYNVVCNITSEEAALKAIQTGELLTIKAYQDASRQDIEDDNINNIINQHIVDGKKTYEYANQQLRNCR
jgi:hypothetical protein